MLGIAVESLYLFIHVQGKTRIQAVLPRLYLWHVPKDIREH
jgi:hypothetical protein